MHIFESIAQDVHNFSLFFIRQYCTILLLMCINCVTIFGELVYFASTPFLRNIVLITFYNKNYIDPYMSYLKRHMSKNCNLSLFFIRQYCTILLLMCINCVTIFGDLVYYASTPFLGNIVLTTFISTIYNKSYIDPYMSYLKRHMSKNCILFFTKNRVYVFFTDF